MLVPQNPQYITVLVLLCNFFLSCFSTPLPPNIPSQFYTKFNASLQSAPGQYIGEMYYNKDIQKCLQHMTFQVGPSQSNITLYLTQNETLSVVNSQCRSSAQQVHYTDYFTWLPNATYGGQVQIGSQLCDYWYLVESGLKHALYSVQNTPVRLNVPGQASNNESIIFVYDFTNFQPQNVGPINEPQECFGNGLICPRGDVETMEFYRFHTDDYSLDNKNVADLLGDTSYVCAIGINGPDQLISLYQVEVNTTWGQYAICNFNVCIALQHFLVGRESSDGAGTDQGQCSPNTQIGNWYSFDGACKCSDGAKVGTNGCAWGSVAINKTISSQCLVSLGFFNACKEGLSSAAQVFNNAFLYNDQRGCPNISFAEFQKQQRVSSEKVRLIQVHDKN